MTSGCRRVVAFQPEDIQPRRFTRKRLALHFPRSRRDPGGGLFDDRELSFVLDSLTCLTYQQQSTQAHANEGGFVRCKRMRRCHPYVRSWWHNHGVRVASARYVNLAPPRDRLASELSHPTGYNAFAQVCMFRSYRFSRRLSPLFFVCIHFTAVFSHSLVPFTVVHSPPASSPGLPT